MTKILKGIGVYPSLTIGKCHIYEKLTLEDLVNKASKEHLKPRDFDTALEKTKKELEELFKELSEKAGEALAEIMEFQLLLLEDENFIGSVKEKISEGMHPAKALLEAINNTKEMFSKMESVYMRERANDVVDLGIRILKNMIGIKVKEEVEEGSIIISPDLSPSEVIYLSKKVAGIATEKGTALSHFAIIARELGIPTVVNVKGILESAKKGKIIAINGLSGIVMINPNPQQQKKFETIKKEWDKQLKQIIAEAKKPAYTQDKVQIKVVANLGRIDEAEIASHYGAEGVGLFRTEFFFLGRETPPTEDEQYNGFKFVVQILSPGDVFIRTLDIGSDKQISYIPLPQEPNPALGKRAIRLYPRELREIILSQIKAILRAASHGNVGIMFPMVADVSEIIEGKRLVEEAKKELTEEKKSFGDAKIGIMIETPAAAVLADKLASHVDFMSIGTNDLTQYTLAADRAGIYSPEFFDHLHPAVLRLIKYIVDSLKDTNVELSVCGESASDIYAIPILIGLGIRKLSVAPLLVPVVKYLVRQFKISELEKLANEALIATSPQNVRKMVSEFYEKTDVKLPTL